MKLISALLLFFASLSIWAYDVPTLTGPVIDQVGLLNTQQAQQLSADISQFKSETSVQLQVLITASLNEEPIESVAIQIFDKWKLGSEKKDDGLLILIAPNEKKMRIEVGQGLEGSVPDVYAKRIVSDVMRPYFRTGKFFEGIQQSITTLKEIIIKGEAGSLQAESQDKTDIPFSILVIVFLLFFFVLGPIMNRMNGRSRYRSGWGGPGFGGGSGWGGGSGSGWSGGGGSSSGGGASGDW